MCGAPRTGCNRASQSRLQGLRSNLTAMQWRQHEPDNHMRQPEQAVDAVQRVVGAAVPA